MDSRKSPMGGMATTRAPLPKGGSGALTTTRQQVTALRSATTCRPSGASKVSFAQKLDRQRGSLAKVKDNKGGHSQLSMYADNGYPYMSIHIRISISGYPYSGIHKWISIDGKTMYGYPCT